MVRKFKPFLLIYADVIIFPDRGTLRVRERERVTDTFRFFCFIFIIFFSDAQDYASSINAIFGETSAVTAENVEEMFNTLGMYIVCPGSSVSRGLDL